MKHTPGPWALEKRRDGGFNLIGDGKTLCVKLDKVLTDSVDFVDGKANARLIATAPEMLSILEKVLIGCDSADEVRHIIAKAKGEL
jgi:hypothetical protein